MVSMTVLLNHLKSKTAVEKKSFNFKYWIFLWFVIFAVIGTIVYCLFIPLLFSQYINDEFEIAKNIKNLGYEFGIYRSLNTAFFCLVEDSLEPFLRINFLFHLEKLKKYFKSDSFTIIGILCVLFFICFYIGYAINV